MLKCFSDEFENANMIDDDEEREKWLEERKKLYAEAEKLSLVQLLKIVARLNAIQSIADQQHSHYKEQVTFTQTQMKKENFKIFPIFLKTNFLVSKSFFIGAKNAFDCEKRFHVI